MSEGPAIGDAPRKGRRDPALAARLLAEQLQEEMAQTTGDPQEQTGVELTTFSDLMFAKVTLPLEVGLKESAWFTFGYTTHLGDPDELADTYENLRDMVITGAFGLAAETQERLAVIKAERDALPITPRT